MENLWSPSADTPFGERRPPSSAETILYEETTSILLKPDTLNTPAERESLKDHVHKILWLFMLRFYGVVVLISKSTKVYAARCEVCIEFGPSPSLPSSVSHEIVLIVATSARLRNVPELSRLTLFSFHCLLRPAGARDLRGCDVQTSVVSQPARCEKVSGIITSCKHAATNFGVILSPHSVREMEHISQKKRSGCVWKKISRDLLPRVVDE